MPWHAIARAMAKDPEMSTRIKNNEKIDQTDIRDFLSRNRMITFEPFDQWTIAEQYIRNHF